MRLLGVSTLLTKSLQLSLGSLREEVVNLKIIITIITFTIFMCEIVRCPFNVSCLKAKGPNLKLNRNNKKQTTALIAPRLRWGFTFVKVGPNIVALF